MKLARLLFLVALFGLSWSVARADSSNDPVVFGKLCTPKNPCDASVLTQGNTTVSVTETFTCNDVTKNCTATDDIINDTGHKISLFGLILNPNPTLDLTYSCLTPQTGLFSCNQVGPTAFSFSGQSICSANADDFKNGVFTTDHDPDDFCGVIIGLSGTESEGLKTGTTVTGSFTTPEPSSAWLLLVGLMGGGLVKSKSLRRIFA